MEQIAIAYEHACEQTAFYSTNGADWYVTWGDSTDWSYGRQGTLDFTLEVSSVKTPAGSTLDGVLDDHLPAVAAWLAQPTQVGGSVLDGETGLAVPAELQLDDGAPFLADPVSGRFERLAHEGPATLSVRATGYEDLELALDLPAEVDVQLTPSDRLALSPEPPLVASGGSTWLDVVEVTLARPGLEPITLEGPELQLPGDLPAGAWDLVTDEGAAPRALFVGEPSDRVHLTDVLVDADVTLTGVGFGEGSRAWILVGDARSPVAVDLRSEGPEELVLDLPDVPVGRVDLLVHTAGATLSVVDLLGEPLVDDPPADTGFFSPPLDEDTGKDTGPGSVEAGGCGCHSAPASLMWLAGPLAVLLRRNR